MVSTKRRAGSAASITQRILYAISLDGGSGDFESFSWGLATAELVLSAVPESLQSGHDDPVHEVASGVYFYRFITGDSSETKRMVLVR